ncbi:hypothetical protein [Natronomonas gomsonensis]|uniref:hypothetical protein n=1 Tax=Natronomonas gomsonensis TaxID=1046043 RepID=UPI0015BBC5CA|nr:hypothetical protein [Natronomonas gomsonensis]
MIVVAGLLIAVLLVGLALVVNGAIYTENLSSREVEGSSQALADDPPTTERLTRSMQEANYNSDTASYVERRSTIRQNVSTWNQHQGASSAQNGRFASSEVAAMQNGTRISQDEYGDFMPAEKSLLDEVTTLAGDFRIDPLGLGDKKNWIITNQTSVRAFEMTIDRTELADKNPTLLAALINPLDAALTGSTVFWVETDTNPDDDDFERVYLLDDGNNVSATVVSFDGGTGTVEGECSARGTNVTLRLTGGKMIGENGSVDCPVLDSVIDDGQQNVYFAGGDEVEGTYQLIVDKPEEQFRDGLENKYGSFLDGVLDALVDLLLALIGGSLEDDDIYHDNPSSGHPYTTTAVYDTSVEMTYQTDRMRFTRNLTVAPESSGLP